MKKKRGGTSRDPPQQRRQKGFCPHPYHCKGKKKKAGTRHGVTPPPKNLLPETTGREKEKKKEQNSREATERFDCVGKGEKNPRRNQLGFWEKEPPPAETRGNPLETTRARFWGLKASLTKERNNSQGACALEMGPEWQWTKSRPVVATNRGK